MESDTQPELTPELTEILRRYVANQEAEQRLREEKKELQAELKQALQSMQGRFWYPTVDGVVLKVSHSRTDNVVYDDDALRQRLGDRFATVARADLKKMRKNMARVEPCLTPILDIVGSVDRDRVKTAVENGTVRPEEFRGAFRKETVVRVAVGRQRPDDDAPAQ